MPEQGEFKVEPGSRAAAVRDKLAGMTPTSAAINARGGETLAMEVVPTVDMPHPVYIESAEGCRMTDVDGNEYIDLTMGFGPHVLGHRPKAVVDAVMRQAQQGWHFGIHNLGRKSWGRCYARRGRVLSAPCSVIRAPKRRCMQSARRAPLPARPR